jgi:hypothetical protein
VLIMQPLTSNEPAFIVRRTVRLSERPSPIGGSSEAGAVVVNSWPPNEDDYRAVGLPAESSSGSVHLRLVPDLDSQVCGDCSGSGWMLDDGSVSGVAGRQIVCGCMAA